MKLKGFYNPEEEYEVNDVFLWNGEAYRVTTNGSASPLDMTNCVRLSPEIAGCAQMIMSWHPPAAPMPHETVATKTTKTTRKKKED